MIYFLYNSNIIINMCDKTISFSNRYNNRITLYNQSHYDFGLSPDESCFCIKAIIDNIEYIIGHNYETRDLARRHAEMITNLFTIQTNVYEVTISNNSIITKKIYDGKNHFSYRLRRDKRYFELSNLNRK